MRSMAGPSGSGACADTRPPLSGSSGSGNGSAAIVTVRGPDQAQSIDALVIRFPRIRRFP
jgi:hypothetical protein